MGSPKGVDDAAQPRLGRPHGRTQGLDLDVGARRHAFDGAEGHQQRAVLAEADDLGGDGLFIEARDLGAGADGQAGQTAAGLDKEAVHGGDPPGNRQRIKPLNGGDQALHSRLSIT